MGEREREREIIFVKYFLVSSDWNKQVQQPASEDSAALLGGHRVVPQGFLSNVDEPGSFVTKVGSC